MKYPIYVHQEAESAFGITFPDVPGLFSAADSIQGIDKAAQEAFELFFDSEAGEVPPPGGVRRGKEFKDGFWMLVDIDLDQVNSKPVRLNISLPSGLVNRIDAYAAAKHMNRSAFLAKAATDAMKAEAI